MKKKKETKFSVALGLFDYINPICYAVTTLSIIIACFGVMQTGWYILFIVGATISMIFGLTIPTVKLLVGLGKLKFKMPVNLVFYVNSGILISSVSLLKYVTNINNLPLLAIYAGIILLLLLIYTKKEKFNTMAVLTGAAGYVLIYTALIILANSYKYYLSIVFYGIAILFFLALCLIGIKANLKDAKVHWIIETCNVLCQALVAISTYLLLFH